MTVIVITGGLGQGKTLYMSFLAHKIASEKNVPIYANYALQDALEAHAGKIKPGSVIAIDEAQYSKVYFEDQPEENTLIVTVHRKEQLKLPKDAGIINVERNDNEIKASNGDVIGIEDYCDLYDAFKIPFPCIV